MTALSAHRAGRQPAILALVAVVHAGALVLLAGSLLPRLIEKLPPPGVRLIQLPPPEPAARVRPALPAPTDYAPPQAPQPVVDIPHRYDESIRPDAGRAPLPEAAGSPHAERSAAFSPPTLRIRDKRLAALVDACYPAAARRRGEEGQALARIVIGPEGQVAAWAVVQGSGSQRLDAALDCVVRRLAFSPARRDGIAVTSEVRLPIAFRLQ